MNNNSDAVVIEVTARQLLEMSGYPVSATNLRKFEESMERFSAMSMTFGELEMPPFIDKYEKLPNGNYRIHVNGKWMRESRNEGVPVPSPLPNHAPTLCLYMMACGGALLSETFTLASLSERLGLGHLDPKKARRAIDRAVVRLNEHLHTLDAEALAKHGIEVPQTVALREDSSGLRFEAERSMRP